MGKGFAKVPADGGEAGMSKVVVITGSGAGLGRTLARQFAGQGARLVLLGRTLAKVEQVAATLPGDALALACDVSSAPSVETAFKTIGEQCGRIDVLINNAATYEPFFVADATEEQIMAPVLTNFAGAILTCRAAIPLIPRGGQIINISSESVVLDYPMLSLYQSSKAGLERFGESLGKELKEQAIRVTTVRAGAMYDEESIAPPGWNPEAARNFGERCARAGIDLRGRATSHFRSVAEVVFGLTVLPADVTVPFIHLDGFRS